MFLQQCISRSQWCFCVIFIVVVGLCFFVVLPCTPQEHVMTAVYNNRNASSRSTRMLGKSFQMMGTERCTRQLDMICNLSIHNDQSSKSEYCLPSLYGTDFYIHVLHTATIRMLCLDFHIFTVQLFGLDFQQDVILVQEHKSASAQQACMDVFRLKTGNCDCKPASSIFFQATTIVPSIKSTVVCNIHSIPQCTQTPRSAHDSVCVGNKRKTTTIDVEVLDDFHDAVTCCQYDLNWRHIIVADPYTKHCHCSIGPDDQYL